MFSVAGMAIKTQLTQFKYSDFQIAIGQISLYQILTAILCCIGVYLIFSLQDVIALRHIGKSIELKKSIAISFFSSAIGNNVGFALGAGTVKYKMYSSLGLSALQVGQVVLFGVLALWLGFFLIGGGVFIYAPVSVEKVTWIQLPSIKLVGALFLLIVVGYIIVCNFFKKIVVIRGHEIRLPSLKLAITQIIISSIDWLLSAYVFYVLLVNSNNIPYINILAIFLLAQIVGMISQVPGGLGIFEAVVVTLVGDLLPMGEVLSALLIFRIIFYLSPLTIAVSSLIYLGSDQVVQSAQQIKKIIKPLTIFIPNLVSLQVFLSGIGLILSGTVPSLSARLSSLDKFLPLAFIEISHFIGSVIGLVLIFLAYGLNRKQKSAYYLAQVVLISGVVFSLFTGTDFETIIFLIITWAILKTSKKHFYRLSRILDFQLNSSWLFMITAVLTVAFWASFFSYKNINYNDSLWWQVQFSSETPRSYRAMLGIGIISLVYVIWQLMRPKKVTLPQTTAEDLTKAKVILQNTGNANSSLALLGDKKFIFSASGKTFIMFGVKGQSWIALGDPVGLKEEWSEVIFKFSEIVDLHDGEIVFYQVRPEGLNQYLDLGLKFFKLGEEAMIPISNFNLEGSENRDYRNKVNKAEKEGAVFEVISKPLSSEVLKELEQISNDWLSEKNVREKGFSLGYFDSDYLRNHDCAVVKVQEKIVAFANIWKSADKTELSVDLIRYNQLAPKNSMDYLFIKLMLWGTKEGYHVFSLGMAPLSGLNQHPLSLRWNKLGTLIFKHGEHFYNFEGLRRYKSKFNPTWEPRYLASSSTFWLPLIFFNLSTLISGGFRGIFKK